MKNHAIEYAKMGWKIIPIFGVKSGRCTCLKGVDCPSAGKHPIINNWTLNASSDPNIIESWFTQYGENINIGITTGRASGVVVIDIDNKNAPMLNMVNTDLSETVIQETGKGYHYFCKYPDIPETSKVKSDARIFPDIDCRADGGLVVISPSHHISGIDYQWKNSPDEWNLIDCPEWFLKEVIVNNNSVESKRGAIDKDSKEIQDNSRNTTLFHLATKYHFLGMSYKSALTALSAVNDEQCIPPLEYKEIEDIVNSAYKYNTELTEDQKISLEIGARASKAFLDSFMQKIELALSTPVKIECPTPTWIPDHGIIKDLSEYILDQSQYPIEPFAVISVISFLGVLAGRRYVSEFNTYTNIYFVGLAESGAGKNTALNMIPKIAYESGEEVYNYIGGSDFASGSAIINSLRDKSERLFLLDEVGAKFNSFTSGKASTHQSDVIRVLMELYSASGGIYQGKEYADKKDKPRIVINNPIVGMYGASTPEQFYKALKNGNAIDGFVPRIMIVPYEGEKGALRLFERKKTPEKIKSFLNEFIRFLPTGNGNLSGKLGSEIDNIEPMVIPFTPEVKKIIIPLSKELNDLGKFDYEKAILARVLENTIKLAMVYAISIDYSKPIINHNAFLWGRNIALWCASQAIEMVSDNVADNEVEAMYKKIETAIKRSKEKGVTKTQLFRIAGTKQRSYEFDSAVKALIENKIIFFANIKTDGRGRNPERYIHAETFYKIHKKND